MYAPTLPSLLNFTAMRPTGFRTPQFTLMAAGPVARELAIHAVPKLPSMAAEGEEPGAVEVAVTVPPSARLAPGPSSFVCSAAALDSRSPHAISPITASVFRALTFIVPSRFRPKHQRNHRVLRAARQRC